MTPPEGDEQGATLDPLAARMIVLTLERLEKRIDDLEEGLAGLGMLLHELNEARPAEPATKNG